MSHNEQSNHTVTCYLEPNLRNLCTCIICTKIRKEWLIESNNEVEWLLKTCFHEVMEVLSLWVCVKCDCIIPRLTSRRKSHD